MKLCHWQQARLEHMRVQLLVGVAMKQYIGTVWPRQCVTKHGKSEQHGQNEGS
jgi:hypothetical protein